VDEAIGPNTTARQRREQRIRRTWVSVIVGALLAGSFVLVTGQTGFPGPGPLRRYPDADLGALAERINGSAACYGSFGPQEPIASVDRLRSRVHLSEPQWVVLAPQDRPMVDDPPNGAMSSGPVSGRHCVGMNAAG